MNLDVTELVARRRARPHALFQSEFSLHALDDIQEVMGLLRQVRTAMPLAAVPNAREYLIHCEQLWLKSMRQWHRQGLTGNNLLTLPEMLWVCIACLRVAIEPRLYVQSREKLALSACTAAVEVARHQRLGHLAELSQTVVAWLDYCAYRGFNTDSLELVRASHRLFYWIRYGNFLLGSTVSTPALATAADRQALLTKLTTQRHIEPTAGMNVAAKTIYCLLLLPEGAAHDFCKTKDLIPEINTVWIHLMHIFEREMGNTEAARLLEYFYAQKPAGLLNPVEEQKLVSTREHRCAALAWQLVFFNRWVKALVNLDFSEHHVVFSAELQMKEAIIHSRSLFGRKRLPLILHVKDTFFVHRADHEPSFLVRCEHLLHALTEWLTVAETVHSAQTAAGVSLKPLLHELRIQTDVMA